MEKTIRLSKQISSVLSYCSRRDAEEMIGQGKVLVNAHPITELGYRVKIHDQIQLKDDPKLYIVEPTKPKFPPRLIIANKKEGEILDTTKPNNFFERIQKFPGISNTKSLKLAMGLDVMASGLVLLTDSMALKHILEKASLNQVFYIRCASHGPPDTAALKWLKSGAKVGNIRFPPVSVTILNSKYQTRSDGYSSEISIAFSGGRFPILRKILSKVGLKVTDADRRKIGPFNTMSVSLGHVAELSPERVVLLLNKAIPNWQEQFQAFYEKENVEE